MAKERKQVVSDLEASKEFIRVKSDNAVIIDFDKICNNSDLERLDVFVLKRKKAYANIKVLICGYINYFIENYDYDNELIDAYLHLKFMIDENKMYKNKKDFISDLYEFLLTDTMVEKIKTMTEDLYDIDLESANKKKSNSSKQYSETLQFNNEHGKIIMCMSVAIKIFIPVMTHYLYKMQSKKVDKFIYKCYKNIYKKFQGDYKINNKLYEMVLSRILKTKNNDQVIWEQGSIRGVDYENQATDSLQKLYVDILPKLTFSGNVVHYCIKSMDLNISHKMSEKYQYVYSPVTGKDVDGFTGFEKMEMHTSRFDESILIQNKINIEQTLKKLQKKFMVEFSDKELDYYMKNLEVKPFQRDLIFQYFAKYFGSSNELCSCNKRNYCKLVILLKKNLSDKGFRFLQHILTGKLTDFFEPKRAVKKKQFLKVMNSERYQNLMEYKYGAISNIFINKKNIIETYVTFILNSKFTLVDYENKKYTGNKINNTEYSYVICDELLRFIDEI